MNLTPNQSHWFANPEERAAHDQIVDAASNEIEVMVDSHIAAGACSHCLSQYVLLSLIHTYAMINGTETARALLMDAQGYLDEHSGPPQGSEQCFPDSPLFTA